MRPGHRPTDKGIAEKRKEGKTGQAGKIQTSDPQPPADTDKQSKGCGKGNGYMHPVHGIKQRFGELLLLLTSGVER